ncbi:MAG TPA: matrixin family metalloprotease [Gemmatimonadaceae bacterium]|jgi:predicted Zn-dependent protease|nr:matrixin family metalloprotease [Gemmatimonadaceae bacterium]
MQHRPLLPGFGRAATFAAAFIASTGFADCASYTASRAGTLGGNVSGILGSSRRPVPRPTLDAILSAAHGTYIDRVIADRDSVVERWSDHIDQPIRVWIDSSATILAGQEGFPAAVRGAFAEWASTGIPLTFVYVGSARDADVRVRWTSHLDHKTGSTTWRTDRNGWLSSGDITLATHISDGQVLDTRGMRAIALHEVGHALGLAHSANVQDIMAPLVHVDGLSIVDRNTIKLLYSLQAGHL